MLEGQGELSAQAKQRAEAPVNGGRNYNGPKVSKFLVGQVTTRTKGVADGRRVDIPVPDVWRWSDGEGSGNQLLE